MRNFTSLKHQLYDFMLNKILFNYPTHNLNKINNRSVFECCFVWKKHNEVYI